MKFSLSLNELELWQIDRYRGTAPRYRYVREAIAQRLLRDSGIVSSPIADSVPSVEEPKPVPFPPPCAVMHIEEMDDGPVIWICVLRKHPPEIHHGFKRSYELTKAERQKLLRRVERAGSSTG